MINNIKETKYELYLTDNLFCNDRTISSGIYNSSYDNLGYGGYSTAYRWSYSPWDDDYNKTVYFHCKQKNDAFTSGDSKNRNANLMYSISLLSSDELVLSGAYNIKNSGFFMYSGQEY